VRFAIVHFTGSADQFRLAGCGLHYEPWIDGDAVSADTGTWLENVYARMAVSELDKLPDVHIEPVADNRQLVCKGDVYVAEGVFRELAHLGSARVCYKQLALAKCAVHGHRAFCTPASNTPDDTIVLYEFGENAARQDTLG